MAREALMCTADEPERKGTLARNGSTAQSLYAIHPGAHILGVLNSQNLSKGGQPAQSGMTERPSVRHMQEAGLYHRHNSGPNMCTTVRLPSGIPAKRKSYSVVAR